MKVLKHVPTVLLFSYVVLMFFRVPIISDALIIITLGSLQGFCYYLSYCGENVRSIKVDQDVISLRTELEKEQLRLRIHEIQTDAHRRSLSKLGGSNGQKIAW